MTLESLNIVLGLCAMLAFGIVSFLQRKLVEKVGVFSSLVYMYAAQFVFLVTAFFIFQKDMPTISLNFFGLAIFLGFIGALGVASYTKALEKGNVSVATVVGRLGMVLTVVFALLFFQETPSFLQWAGIFLALIGAIAASVPFRDIQNSMYLWKDVGMWYAAVAALVWGVFFTFYKMLVVRTSPFVASFFVEGTIFFIFLFSTLKIKTKKPDKSAVVVAIATGFGLAAGALAYTASVGSGLVSVSAALLAASPLVTSVLAWMFLHERLEVNQYAGIVISVLGIVLVSL